MTGAVFGPGRAKSYGITVGVSARTSPGFVARAAEGSQMLGFSRIGRRERFFGRQTAAPRQSATAQPDRSGHSLPGSTIPAGPPITSRISSPWRHVPVLFMAR